LNQIWSQIAGGTSGMSENGEWNRLAAAELNSSDHPAIQVEIVEMRWASASRKEEIREIGERQKEEEEAEEQENEKENEKSKVLSDSRQQQPRQQLHAQSQGQSESEEIIVWGLIPHQSVNDRKRNVQRKRKEKTRKEEQETRKVQIEHGTIWTEHQPKSEYSSVQYTSNATSENRSEWPV
jgi:hypothetical protein